jgi:SLT domain-containing protein
MTTFRAYAGPFRNRSIYDPMANIYAAINYAMHTYGRTLMRGGMGMGSGHGYASGGLMLPGQSGVVGEAGREYVDALPGGGAVITPERGSAGSSGGGVTVYQQYYGTQYPTIEQRAVMKQELAMALVGAP